MFLSAGMAELADAADLKSAGLKKLVGVRVPLSAPTETQGSFDSAQDFVLRRRSGQALRAPASLTPAKRLNLKSAGLKKLVGVRVPLSAPGLYTFRAQRGIPFVTMVDREIFLGSFDSAALRSDFVLRLHSGQALRAPSRAAGSRPQNGSRRDSSTALWTSPRGIKGQPRDQPSFLVLPFPRHGQVRLRTSNAAHMAKNLDKAVFKFCRRRGNDPVRWHNKARIGFRIAFRQR